MAETRTSRILDVSGKTESGNEQQYIEVGPNLYLGTKDGMKYSLIQTPDSQFRLVEAVSDLNMSLNKGNFEMLQSCEDPNNSKMSWPEINLNDSTQIKAISVASEPSPCKGQGDEIGNCVLTPPNSFSNFKGSNNCLMRVKEESPVNVGISPVFTYTPLLPREKERDPVVTFCNASRRSSFNNFSPIFPSPTATGSGWYGRHVLPNSFRHTPRTRARRGTRRMRRPRQPNYLYTPQMLHSTPTTLASGSYSSFNDDCSLSQSANASGSFDSTLSSINYPSVPHNTPTSPDEDSVNNQKVFSEQWMPQLVTLVENSLTNPRELHNLKERNRRLRIKNACQSMRELVPGMNDKTDNATVFEQAANFLTFMREVVGNECDMEFLEQNCY